VALKPVPRRDGSVRGELRELGRENGHVTFCDAYVRFDWMSSLVPFIAMPGLNPTQEGELTDPILSIWHTNKG